MRSSLSEGLVAATVSNLGRIDILINNASIRRNTPITEMTFAEWREVMGSSLDCAYLMTRNSVPHMIQICAPRVMNIKFGTSPPACESKPMKNGRYIMYATISTGTLQIGSGGTTGSLATGSAITNNATLAFNRSNPVTEGTDFASVIGGSGGVTQAGSGTLILSGANTYAGKTRINNGTLSVNNVNVSATADCTASPAASEKISASDGGIGGRSTTEQ